MSKKNCFPTGKNVPLLSPYGVKIAKVCRDAYQAGQGVEQLAAQLQRSPRAIAKRLEKLELVVAER